jgi:hypothetical protein
MTNKERKKLAYFFADLSAKYGELVEIDGEFRHSNVGRPSRGAWRLKNRPVWQRFKKEQQRCDAKA